MIAQQRCWLALALCLVARSLQSSIVRGGANIESVPAIKSQDLAGERGDFKYWRKWRNSEHYVLILH